jgi:hypothetical protein
LESGSVSESVSVWESVSVLESEWQLVLVLASQLVLVPVWVSGLAFHQASGLALLLASRLGSAWRSGSR